jgi:hypothetical protein
MINGSGFIEKSLMKIILSLSRKGTELVGEDKCVKRKFEKQLGYL